jgi:hypothetical protein
MEESDGALYGSECYFTLHPDPPPPDRLYIFGMRRGIPQVLGCLRLICPSGLQRDGSGSALQVEGQLVGSSGEQ